MTHTDFPQPSEPQLPTFRDKPDYDPEPDQELGRELRRAVGLFTVTELAALLDCKETTLMSWRMNGMGPPFVKISKLLYYRVEDIKNWMAENVKLATRAPPMEPEPSQE